MTIKIKITPERFSEATNILEYLNVLGKDKETVARIAPRFVLNDKDEYIVKVVYDDDGDIKEFENYGEAFLRLTGVTPKRLAKLADEFAEAARNIVNPQSGKG